MSKRHKKDLSPEDIRRKRMKRLKRKINRLIMLALVLGAGYAFYKPEIIPSQPVRAKVEGVREVLFSQTPHIQEKASGVLGAATSEFNRVAKTTKLPKNLTGMPEEVVVEDVVDQLGQQIRDLPQTQIQRIKTQFCQDVIDAATDSAHEQNP